MMRYPHRLLFVLVFLAAISSCNGGGLIAPPAGQDIVAAFSHIAPDEYVIGKTVFFDASESADPLFQIRSYTWDFGDGSVPASGSNPGASHIFNSPDTYGVKLTVEDVAGRKSSTTTDIRIYVPGHFPVARFAYEAPDGWQPGCVVQFDASCTSDADDDLVSYTWDWGDKSLTGPSSVTEAAHQFTNAGDYEVTLTAEDSTGRTNVRGPIILSFGYPTNPRHVSTLSPMNPGYGGRMEASNGYVYYPDDQNGIQVIDARDPANPKALDPIAPLDQVFSLATSGDLICAITGDFYCLGVSDPSKTDILGYAQGMSGNPVTRGHFVYLWGGNGLEVADITNPFEPKSASVDGPVMGYPIQTEGLALTDNYAYNKYEHQFFVYDIGDPYNLKYLGSIESEVTGVGAILAGAGHFLYSFGTYWDGSADKYVNTVKAYDVTDPMNPTLICSSILGLEDWDQVVKAVVIGHYAYVLYYRSGDSDKLVVVDIGDPTAMVPVSSVVADAYGNKLVVDGRYAYVSGVSKLRIVELW
jgi:hypothetical protein